MLKLESRADLQQLIDDQVGESIEVEFKRSEALARTNEAVRQFSKDVSALANSAGGQIVYGIAERDGLPIHLDQGCDTAVIQQEWVEQMLNTKIAPRIAGIKVCRFR